MDKIHQLAQTIAIVFGVLAPCTLLAGYVYHLGYISTFGLSSELISRSLGEVIAESWFVGFSLLAWLLNKWWVPLVFLAVVGLLLLILLFILVNLKPENLDKLKAPITKQNQGRKVFGLTLWLWKSWFGLVGEIGHWVWLLAAVISIAASLVIFPYKNGSDLALKQIAELQESNCETIDKSASSVNCIYLVDITSESKEPVAKGILVSANNNRVAIFNGSTLEVWPLLDTYRLTKSFTRDLD